MFTKLDANNGFWQVKLTEECAKLTTFISLIGRFHFNRLPYGLNSASEYFMKTMAQALDSVVGVVCHMDDILVYGRNQQEHDRRLESNHGVLNHIGKFIPHLATRTKLLQDLLISTNGHGASTLPKLQEGDKVYMLERQEHGTITEPATTPRSYTIQTTHSKLRCNTRQLVLTGENPSSTPRSARTSPCNQATPPALTMYKPQQPAKLSQPTGLSSA